MQLDEETKERIRKMLRQQRKEFEEDLAQARKKFKENNCNGNNKRLDTLRKCIWNLNEAIKRVNQGTYGVCQKCGEQIPLGRLAAVPWAKHCTFCKTLLSNGRVGAVS